MTLAQIKESELIVTFYRDGSVRYHGTGQIIHLPTGFTEEFNFKWNDWSGKKDALKRLSDRIHAKSLASDA